MIDTRKQKLMIHFAKKKSINQFLYQIKKESPKRSKSNKYTEALAS